MATDGTADIVVVGGGMVGLASAIALKDRGLDVVLCDPGEARARTSYGNAGVVSRGSILPMSSPALWGKLPPTCATPIAACACTTRISRGSSPTRRISWRPPAHPGGAARQRRCSP